MSKQKRTTKQILNQLVQLYKKIPETKGCLENINKEGGCKGWCCSLQSPQVLKIEFVNSWNYVLNNFAIEEMEKLVFDAINTYLLNWTTKGCIFFDKESKLCKQHSTRGLSCRTYGIIPAKEFKLNYERLKKLYHNKIGAVIKDQCDLISTINGSKVTIKDTDSWWNSLVKIEKEFGVSKNRINDDLGGSYRTYHDHLLIHLYGEDVLENLSIIRTNGTDEEKMQATISLVNHFLKQVSDALE